MKSISDKGISMFLCNVCTYIHLHLFHNPAEYICTFMHMLDYIANLINGLLQILICGKPFYWGLKYNNKIVNNKRFIVLANGPSLSEDLTRLLKHNDIEQLEFGMMNFATESDLLFQIKPKYFFIADHVFFKDTSKYIQDFYKTLNDKVDWEMTLVISYNIKKIQLISEIKNPNIKFQRCYALEPDGPSWWKNWLCKNGYAIPGLGTVTNLAAYAGIQYGYKHIEFCGNDMSLLDGLCVNDENIPCMRVIHYYEQEVELQPLYVTDDKYLNLRETIENVIRMVIAHKAIADYGNHLGVKFINRTRNSMLDCYPRLIQIHPEEFDD